MVTIHVDGEDKTAQISDWSIGWNDQRETLQLICHFPSGKTYKRPFSNCRICPARELGERLLTKSGSTIARPVESATIYSERYALVRYPNSAKPYLHKLDNIDFTEKSTMPQTPVFQYLVAVAKARQECAGSHNDHEMAANIVRQLEKLPASVNTVLHAYCTGQNRARTPGKGLIYPFGVNASQLAAVERAFSAQISLIEGPPGTGKTQTILNILANVLLRGQTVAVLSNNNAAVENVYEKLEKFGLGHLVGKLGNRDNRQDFFAQLPPWPSSEPEPAPTLDDIQALLSRLKQHLSARNRAAQLQIEIDELRIERYYLQQWQKNSGVQATASLDKYGLSPRKTADLMAYLAYLGEQRIRLKERIALLFNFKIFRVHPFAEGDTRLSVFYALQMHYYDQALRNKQAEFRACRKSLERGNFEVLLDALTKASMCYLKQSVHSKKTGI